MENIYGMLDALISNVKFGQKSSDYEGIPSHAKMLWGKNMIVRDSTLK